ncbi:X-box-binding protein 1 isoform X2 [Cyrtonyx montezumae]|uniref:X-box-binding protein 1 isoform X2 n=1 Tax=Cyrtonyx montezumae TaxID=9017 RepID=UPI0032DAA2FC
MAAVCGAPRLLLFPGDAAEPAAGRRLSVVLPAGAAPGPPEAPPPARKRQRLTHLSPEEKALRRKLKNRVAAQSARDRKKARMTELEQQVVELEEKNQQLLRENQRLRERTGSLSLENQELRRRLGLDALKTEPECEPTVSALRSTQTTCSSAAGTGPAVTISDNLHMDSDGSDSSDSESDLLGFLDNLDPEMFLKCADSESSSLEKLEEEICGETNSIPTTSSPSLGSPSAKLEAINELIRFDHIYTKPLILEFPVKMGNETNMLVKIEGVSLSPPEDKAIAEVPVCVKEEPVDSLMPELGISHLLPSHHSFAASHYLLDAGSDSGYEGSLSPFSDMPSPLDTDRTWEDSFANELFPQLISV